MSISLWFKPSILLNNTSGLPDYLSDPKKNAEPQGWERPESIAMFGTWCARASARWGGEVDWWATINEPLVNPIAGYIQGSFPPGLLLGVERALLVGKNEARAHARCFDAIKSGRANDVNARDVLAKLADAGRALLRRREVDMAELRNGVTEGVIDLALRLVAAVDVGDEALRHVRR